MSDEILFCDDKALVRLVRVDSYPGGEPLIDFPRRHVVRRVLLRPRSMSMFHAAMFWIDALKARGHQTPDLILPLVPGSRQDRLSDAGDFLFTIKSVANEINARQFPSVTILDPHSDVTPALIDRCVVRRETPGPRFAWSAVIAPDGGAEKRASFVAQQLEVPLLHAWKSRDVATGKISGFGMEPCRPLRTEPTRMLVVDDICDGGGTFIGLADAMDRYGIVADLFVTHGIFSQGTAPLLCRYRKVFCTDSVLGEKPGVEVMKTCELFLQGAS